MKKSVKQNPQDSQVLDVLKKLTKRIEESTVDIHSIKYDIKSMKFDITTVKSDTEITKVDVEKIKENMEGFEARLNKRITYIADLITIKLGGKIKKQERRISKLERVQQLS